MATDDPFAVEDESPSSTDRKRRLSLYGLMGAGPRRAATTSEDLQEQPLYGGDISRNTSLPSDVGEPSQLATERVQRAPYSEQTTPLLGPQEQLGNAFSEIDRGEEGSYGGLSEGARNASLRNFFRPGIISQNTNFGPGDDQVPQQVRQAKQAYGYANQLDQQTGGNVRGALKDLVFGTGGERGGTGGTSLSDMVRSGGSGSSAAGSGLYAGYTGNLAPAYEAGGATALEPGTEALYGAVGPEYGLFTGVGAEGAGTGAGAAGAAAEGAGGASSAGTAAGAAGASASTVISSYLAAYALMKLAYQYGVGGGEGPSSGNQWYDLAMGLLGPVGDIGMAFANGAWEPSKAWQTFGGELGGNISNESRSLRNLALNLQNAKTQGDILQNVDLFNQAIRTGIPSYATAEGPQISPLPGATGKRHEWGIEANFDNPVNDLNSTLAALYGSLPAGEATPLSPAAFNWGEGLGDEGYNLATKLSNEMAQGGTPDISGYSSPLQNLINSFYQRFQTVQQADEINRKAAEYNSTLSSP